MNLDVTVVASFIFTVLVLSYVFLGDNFLFRIATYAFIGVAAAYVLLIAFEQVVWPQLVLPLVRGQAFQSPVLYLVPLVLGVLLLFKVSPRLGRVGSLPMAYLVGVGAAVAIGGAVLGTLFPQSLASINLFSRQNLTSQGSEPASVGLLALDALFILIGSILTLAYFQFSGKARPNQSPQRNPLVEGMAKLGQFFIAVTFGSLFAGVYIAALTALVDRITFLINFVKTL